MAAFGRLLPMETGSNRPIAAGHIIHGIKVDSLTDTMQGHIIYFFDVQIFVLCFFSFLLFLILPIRLLRA